MEITKSVVDTVDALPDQLWEAWEESRKVTLPPHYKNFKRVLICGMGGSALGGRVVKAYAADQAKASIDVSTEYNLPLYAYDETLIIVSSYSGNTEETVSIMNQAVEKKLPVFVISAGGKLAELADAHSLPIYKIDPHFNPSGQPRLAVGYSIGAIFGALTTAGVLDESSENINRVVQFLKDQQPKMKVLAEEWAKVLKGKIPILVASEHLVGAAHVVKNQFNETAKTFSTSFDIPELNHHLMEGLKNPSEATSKLIFVFVQSDLYSERVRARYPLTTEVVQKNNVETFDVTIAGDTKLEQVFKLIQLGSYAQAYLGVLYGEDPLSIPWVDYFKEKLAR